MLRYLVLFDIDGTLVQSDGAGKAAMKAALQRVFGTPGTLNTYPLYGATDRMIVQNVLAAEGISREVIDARFDELCELMAEELATRLVSHRVRPCDGGLALVAALQAREDVLVGLVTGNARQTAMLKLEAAGYQSTAFRVGAFGAERAERAELPPLAVERAWAQSGHRFEGPSIIIIGDTPADISCGQSVNARSVAVATGRYSVEQLRKYAPDSLLASLLDTEKALNAILAG